MPHVNITLPDGSVKPFDRGVTPMDIALSISEGLARNCVVAEVNHRLTDMSAHIEEDASVRSKIAFIMMLTKRHPLRMPILT